MAGPDGKIPADAPSEGRRESPNGPRLALGPREAKRLNTDGLRPAIVGLTPGSSGLWPLPGCRCAFSGRRKRSNFDGTPPVLGLTLDSRSPLLLLGCRLLSIHCDASGAD